MHKDAVAALDVVGLADQGEGGEALEDCGCSDPARDGGGEEVGGGGGDGGVLGLRGGVEVDDVVAGFEGGGGWGGEDGAFSFAAGDVRERGRGVEAGAEVGVDVVYAGVGVLDEEFITGGDGERGLGVDFEDFGAAGARELEHGVRLGEVGGRHGEVSDRRDAPERVCRGDAFGCEEYRVKHQGEGGGRETIMYGRPGPDIRGFVRQLRALPRVMRNGRKSVVRAAGKLLVCMYRMRGRFGGGVTPSMGTFAAAQHHFLAWRIRYKS